MTWLNALATAKPETVGAQRLRRRIVEYKHQLPSSMEAQTFTEWIGRAASVDLRVHECCLTLRDAAKAHSERATAKAVQAQNAAWTSWLEGGPATGLKRQHQMSRVATGWVPSIVERDEEESDEGEPDECRPSEAKDSMGQLAHGRWVQGPGQHEPSGEHGAGEDSAQPAAGDAGDVIPGGNDRPASRQQAVEAAADDWDVQWGADLRLPECAWPQDMGALPPPP